MRRHRFRHNARQNSSQAQMISWTCRCRCLKAGETGLITRTSLVGECHTQYGRSSLGRHQRLSGGSYHGWQPLPANPTILEPTDIQSCHAFSSERVNGRSERQMSPLLFMHRRELGMTSYLAVAAANPGEYFIFRTCLPRPHATVAKLVTLRCV